VPTVTAQPHSTSFGRTPWGEAGLYTLQNEDLAAGFTDYAGALVFLKGPDRDGKRDHVVLGFDSVAGYLDNRGSFGALLGRNANRIAGGRIIIDGQPHELSRNEGKNTLHGGAVGFGKRLWSLEAASAKHLTFGLKSADGDQGFPGQVSVAATWMLEGSDLSLTFRAETTKATPLSLSAHPYFNLDGSGAAHCLEQEVEIFADFFLPTDQRQIPTGELRAVAGSPFDFRKVQQIGARIRERCQQLRFGRGYDHYFVLPTRDRESAVLAARVRSGRSGRVLEILTTQPGLQFYSGNNLDGSVTGRDGLYRQSAGFAFEPQGFPNAPNELNFPSTLLRPGEVYRQEITYRLATDGSERSR
jgi:aldose 1-epimerase